MSQSSFSSLPYPFPYGRPRLAEGNKGKEERKKKRETGNLETTSLLSSSWPRLRPRLSVGQEGKEGNDFLRMTCPFPYPSSSLGIR